MASENEKRSSTGNEPDLVGDDEDDDIHFGGKQIPPEYGEKRYWEERYKASSHGQPSPVYSTTNTECYDWYQEYSVCLQLKSFINQHAPKQNRILMVGCGNSKMSEQMVEDGYREIINIDFSENVINTMKRRATEKNIPTSALSYLAMDARDLQFDDNPFDTVIDKGTIDAQMCSSQNLSNVAKTCDEISRVLKPGGVFIVITYGRPDSRVEHLDKPQYNWTLQYTTVSKNDSDSPDSVHYIYYMVKKPSSN